MRENKLISGLDNNKEEAKSKFEWMQEHAI